MISSQPIVKINSFCLPTARPSVAFGLAVALATLAGACTDAQPDDAAAVDWSRVEFRAVAMAEYRFIPSQLDFRRGVAYRLRLENQGTELHEFTAPDFPVAIELRDPAVLAPGKTEIIVPPRSAKDLYFVARRPGRYVLSCADHDWAGMTGTITIE